MAQARHATRSDVPALARALGRAFRDDPVWRWMAPDEKRWLARADRVFERVASARLRCGHTFTTDDCAGAAMWAPPGYWRESWSDQLRELPAMTALISVTGVRRGLNLIRDMEAAHPKNDHWYLAVLGTDPDSQGKGVGSSLLAPVIARCDLDGTGAYLESSNPGNVPFYERHGFRVTGRIRSGSCPPIDAMWRDPAPPSST